MVRNLKDVEGFEMTLPAIGVSRMRNSNFKASRAMTSGVKVFLDELEVSILDVDHSMGQIKVEAWRTPPGPHHTRQPRQLLFIAIPPYTEVAISISTYAYSYR